MASIITVKIKYSDNSRSLTEDFSCAKSHPSPEVLQELEQLMIRKWEDKGGQFRDVQIHTKVRYA